MDSLLKDVTRYGTAARVARLKRSDLAGKTGTTNEFVDAWFAGYQPNLVAITWVGFDQPKSLGRNQTGGAVALPIWIHYMEKMLKDVPEAKREMPPGIVVADVVDSVAAPTPDDPAAVDLKIVPEYFYREYVPPAEEVPPAEDASQNPDQPAPSTFSQ
jgi:penicillin-binding protein 1A